MVLIMKLIFSFQETKPIHKHLGHFCTNSLLMRRFVALITSYSCFSPQSHVTNFFFFFFLNFRSWYFLAQAAKDFISLFYLTAVLCALYNNFPVNRVNCPVLYCSVSRKSAWIILC